MIKRFIMVAGLLSIVLLAAVPAPRAVAFNLFGGSVCNNDTSGSAVCADSSKGNCPSGTPNCDSNPITGSNGLLINITDIVAFVAGAAAILLIIIGGLRYITSAGNTEKANSARSTIINALIGLAVIVLATSLITYVVGKL
jgi:hypothetical protein